MPACRAVEAPDVVKQFLPCFCPDSVDFLGYPLGIQLRKETLYCRVFASFVRTIHAACDALLLEQLPEVLTDVLAALIRMMY